MSNVISFVMVGTNDLEKSNKFYEPIMKLLGLKQVSTTDRYIGYGHQKNNEVKFYITKPHNKEKATFGNGTMVALSADTKEIVDVFHAKAIENGAVDEGKPGLRSDGNYYGYIRDLDGNKITVRYVVN